MDEDPWDEFGDADFSDSADDGYEFSSATRRQAQRKRRREPTRSKATFGEVLVRELKDYRTWIAAVVAVFILLALPGLYRRSLGGADAPRHGVRGLLLLLGVFTTLAVVPVFALGGHSWARNARHHVVHFFKQMIVASVVGGMADSAGFGAAVASQMQRAADAEAKKRRLPFIAGVLTSCAVGALITCFLLSITGSIREKRLANNNSPAEATQAPGPAKSRFVDKTNWLIDVEIPSGAEVEPGDERFTHIAIGQPMAGREVPYTRVDFTIDQAILSVRTHRCFDGVLEKGAANSIAAAIFSEFPGAPPVPEGTAEHAQITQYEYADATDHVRLAVFRQNGQEYHIVLTCPKNQFAEASAQFDGLLNQFRIEHVADSGAAQVEVATTLHRSSNSFVHGSAIGGRCAVFWERNNPDAVSGDVLEIWDLDTGETERRAENYAVACAAVSPDGRCIATARTPDDVTIWKRESGTIKPVFSTQAGSLHGVNSRRDGARTRSPFQERVLTANAVAFSVDGTKVAVASHGGEVTLFDAIEGRLIGRATHASGQDLSWSPDGSRIACVDGTSSRVTVWDANTGEEQARFSTETPAQNVCFFANGEQILSGAKWMAQSSGKDTTFAWNLATGNARSGFSREREDVTAVAASGSVCAKLSRFVGKGSRQHLAILDPETGADRLALTTPRGEMKAASIRFGVDGRVLLCAGVAGDAPFALMFDVETGIVRRRLIGVEPQQ